MRLFTNDEAVIAEGAVYLRIVAPSYLFSSVTMVYLNIMRSVERVVVSTVVFLVSLLANIALNALFIFGLLGLPAMGIAGAALATACARLIELILVLVYAHWIKTSPRVDKRVRLRFSDIFVRDRLLFGDFMRYSLPVIANELMWGLGTSMSAVVIGHISTQMVAANAVAQVARQLATVVSFGIANAAAMQDPEKRRKIEQIDLLLQGALRAESLVCLKMNAPAAKLEAVLALLPSLTSPTVAPLQNGEWLSLETVVSTGIVRDLIPQLREAGAEGILEYALNKVI